MPREGALDSQAVLMITNLGRQKAEALHTDFVKFEPGEFAEKLVIVSHDPSGQIMLTIIFVVIPCE